MVINEIVMRHEISPLSIMPETKVVYGKLVWHSTSPILDEN